MAKKSLENLVISATEKGDFLNTLDKKYFEICFYIHNAYGLQLIEG